MRWLRRIRGSEATTHGTRRAETTGNASTALPPTPSPSCPERASVAPATGPLARPAGALDLPTHIDPMTGIIERAETPPGVFWNDLAEVAQAEFDGDHEHPGWSRRRQWQTAKGSGR